MTELEEKVRTGNGGLERESEEEGQGWVKKILSVPLSGNVQRTTSSPNSRASPLMTN